MKTIALANQKGGVGKTTTAASLGIGLSRQGQRVLLIDADAQGNLTQMLGWPQPDELFPTLADLMGKIITDQTIIPGDGILHHESGVDLLPANIELSALEVTLVNAMSRETVMRQLLSTVQDRYDYALIDCMPSLGMLTLNALSAADSVIIPVQAHYLPAKGLEQLLKTVSRVKRQLTTDTKSGASLIFLRPPVPAEFRKRVCRKIRRRWTTHCGSCSIPPPSRSQQIPCPIWMPMRTKRKNQMVIE